MKKTEALTGTLILFTFALTGCDPSPNKPVQPTAAAGVNSVAAITVSSTHPESSDLIDSDPVAGTLDEVKTLSYEARSKVSTIADKMDREVTALRAQWVAEGQKIPDEAEKQYRETRRVLAEKMRALTFATPETWNTAKEEAAMALQNVRGALHAMDTSTK